VSRRLQKLLVIGAFVLLSLAGDRVFVGDAGRTPDLVFSLNGLAGGGPLQPVRYLTPEEANYGQMDSRLPSSLRVESPPAAARPESSPASPAANESHRGMSPRTLPTTVGGSSLVDIRSPFRVPVYDRTGSPAPRVQVLFRNQADEPGSGAAAVEEPTIPLSLLVNMVGEDPWMNTLSQAEENPFTHAIRQEVASTENTAAQSSSQTGTQTTQPSQGNSNGATPPADASNTSGNTNPPGEEQEPGTSTSSGEAKPEAVLFVASASGSVVALRADCESDRVFRIDQNRVLEVEHISFLETKDYNDYFIVSDFNQDGLADVLRTGKSDGAYQLFLNEGSGWTPMSPGSLPFHPSCGAWLKILDPVDRQLAFINPRQRLLEVLQAFGDGTFGSLFSFSLPGDYDALAGEDFTHDGYDDLILQNFSQNKANYLANAAGAGFRPLATNAPSFPQPVMGRFTPRPNQGKASFWFCQFETQNLVYIVNRYSRAVPVVLFGDFGVETCLILADFDQNGTVDIAVGHIVR
jgi:hypothetical protein